MHSALVYPDGTRDFVQNDDSDIPIYVPNEKIILPSASDFINFRRKYPKVAGGSVNQPVAAMIPFIAAAHEHAETAQPIISKRVATNPGEQYEFNVPSYGYIRAIWLEVTMTAGKTTSGELLAGTNDFPWNCLEYVSFLDTNGAPIVGPITGYNLFLANLFGGYTYQQDPRMSPAFEEATVALGMKFRFQLRIPIEISHHDGTGCIGNQNASAPYRIRINLAPNLTFYKKEPEEPTKQTLTVRPILEAWTLPTQVDALGRPQAQLPPNYGTVQYWSERNVVSLTTGNQQIQVTRVGNLIRNLIFVGRKTSPTGERSDKVFPEYPIVNWDARQLYNETQTYRQVRTLEPLETNPAEQKTTKSVGGRPTGVYAYTFDRTNQDRAGDDKPWLWLPTVEATRLELTGSLEEEGTVQILTNDIAPAEVNPTQRYAVPSATGFTPETGARNPNQP